MTAPNGSVDLYLRMSQDRTGQGAGHDRQLKDCRALAKRLGLTVRHVYEDTKSATDPGIVRPGFEALLAGNPAAIITWHEDRLIRQTRDLDRVISLGVDVHVVKHGRLELSTPTGRAVAKTVVAWAQFEQEHKAERQRSANLQRAEAGKPWRSSTRTFGLEPDGCTPRKDEAKRVREAYRDVLAGVSTRSILRTWAAAGVLTTTGGTWGTRSLVDMLKRPVYAGRRTYEGKDVGPLRNAAGEPVAPIVDPDTWAAVQVVLADPTRRTTNNAGRGPLWLLSGIARCGHEGCGAPMLTGSGRGGPRGDRSRIRYRTLKCSAARHLDRAAEPIERYVVAHVLERLALPDVAELLRDPAPDLGPLRAEAAALRGQREQLAADLTVSHDFAAARDRRLRAELDRVEAEIAERSRATVLARFEGRDPVNVWAALDLDTRRAVIRELVEVLVLPTGRCGRAPFRPESVRITPVGAAGQ